MTKFRVEIRTKQVETYQVEAESQEKAGAAVLGFFGGERDDVLLLATETESYSDPEDWDIMEISPEQEAIEARNQADSPK